jgi:hypothetical protein
LPDQSALHDWVDLNRALGDTDHIFAWLDRAAGELAGRLDFREQPSLFCLLVQRRRWADLGTLIAEPAAYIERSHSGIALHAEYLGVDLDDPVLERPRALNREYASVVCHALLAARRADDAADTSVRARALDRSAEMSAALSSPSPVHELIDVLAQLMWD